MWCNASRALTLRELSCLPFVSCGRSGCSPRFRWANSPPSGARSSLRCQSVTGSPSRFVDEFLAVRALGILCLLAAEPLLDAAFLRYETSRLLITVFAYALIVAGLFWVAIPYVLRDQINWSTRSVFRWRCLHAIALIYGGVILTFAFTQY